MPEITREPRSESWRRQFIAKHRARCHYCNRPGRPDMGPDERPWHVDHKKPLARGGEDIEKNLTLACKRCNLAKGVKPYEQFRAFALAAFWQPDDWRASEGDLDQLMSWYEWSQLDDQQGGWIADTENERIIYVYEAGGDQTTKSLLRWDGEPEYTRGGQRPGGRSQLHLIADMYRLMPAMVAEIRMLRAELAERDATEEAAA